MQVAGGPSHRLATPCKRNFRALWDLSDFLGPRLRYERAGDTIQLHWDLGMLQLAPSVNGTWTDLPAASPFPLSPIGDKGLFRVKVEE